MKRILLSAAFMLNTCTLFAQNANNPNIVEDTLQVHALWDAGGYAVANVNAYSRSNTDINGVSSDLYVFSWDRGDVPNHFYDIYSGMAVRQYNNGIQINNGATPIASDWIDESNARYPSRYVSSLEPGILKNGDSTIIALTYYSGTNSTPLGGFVTGDFYLNLYLWNYNNSNALTLYETINLSHSGGQLLPGWIHQDVNNADSMVITWEQDGRIYTRAGVMTTTGLQLGKTSILDVPYPGTKPDVAMMRNSNGTLDLYYVFNEQNNQKLYVCQGDFTTLYNIAGLPLPVSQLYSRVAMGTFGLPRIDAPDNAQYPNQENVWSCVVRDHMPNRDFIFAATSSNLTGITEKFLNNGSLPGLPDITSVSINNGVEDFSCRPTVAFSNQDLNIFYAWTFRNPVWYTGNSNPAFVSYLSVKTTVVLDPMNSPGYQYFVIPYYTYATGYENEYPSVALSTENDASSRLFSAFTEGTYQHPLTPYFGFKTIDWGSDNGFKPGVNTGIGETSDDGIFSVAPNPFHNSFRIQLNAKEGETFHLTLYNILGQEVYADKGTLPHINKGLLNVERDLSPGTCFLELKSSADKVYRKELVKW